MLTAAGSLILVLLALAVTGLALGRRPQSRALVYGGCFGIATALVALGLAALAFGREPETLVLPLGVPWLGMHLRLDPLSAFFMLVVDLGAALACLYALGYARSETAPRRVLPFVPAFLAGMNLVLLADDAFTFLLAWEFMSLTSWALVLARPRGGRPARGGLPLSGHGQPRHGGAAALHGPARRAGRRLRLRQHPRPRAGADPAGAGAGPGRVRRRVEGRPRAPSRLAAARPRRGTQPCLGPDERRDDQGRGVRRHAHPVRPCRAPRHGGGGRCSCWWVRHPPSWGCSTLCCSPT